jgi:hypothetical protein
MPKENVTQGNILLSALNNTYQLLNLKEINIAKSYNKCVDYTVVLTPLFIVST